MKYRVHLKEKGKPNNIGVSIDVATGISEHCIYFSCEANATDWLKQKYDDMQIGLSLGDYVIVPYDDDGNMLEKAEASDVEVASDDAMALVAKSTDIRMIVSAMLAARQMYAVALTALPGAIQNVPLPDTSTLKSDDLAGLAANVFKQAHPMAMEVLIQSVADQSKQA